VTIEQDTEPLSTAFLRRDDGIIDHVAVDMAVKAIRKIRLTPRERAEAVRQLLARGDRIGVIADRLQVPEAEVRGILDELGFEHQRIAG
jgi:hypothetical protein